MRRLDVITTRPTPLEDEYGPPRELDEFVQILIEQGKPVPDRFIELTNLWRANNGMPERDPALIASGAEFHLQGQHDQQTHGNRGGAVTVDSPDDGYRKLRSGKPTTMAATDAVDVLRRIGRDGGDPIDLTNLTIDRHDIFVDARRNGIRERGDMPQIPEAQLDNFRAHLEEAGVHFEVETVDPLDLHSTQTELDAVKVGQMLDKIVAGTFVAGHHPWVSNDDYVLDGHHRWAAFAVMEAAGLTYPEMQAQRVDLPIRTLLGVADEFNREHDVTRKTIGMSAVLAEHGFHLKGTPDDHDQQSHAGGGGSTWNHRSGKRLQVKDTGSSRKMGEKRALAAAQKVADDVARYFGETPGQTKAPEVKYPEEAGRVLIGDHVPHAQFGKDGRIWINPVDVEQMGAPDVGVSNFRKIAHEAVHAYVSGTPYTYEGHTSTYEEGAAELLSLRYWHDQGQPYTDLDAIKPPGGATRWTKDPVDHLAASTVYADEVIETARRAASSVGGWDDRDAVFAEVERVMRGDGNARLDWRDSTDPEFALPDGVDHADNYDTARTLVRYLLTGEPGLFRRRDGLAAERFHLKGTEHDHDQQSHAGGSGSGVPAEFAEPPPGYRQEFQDEWRAAVTWMNDNEMPDWWNGLDYIADDGLPARKNEVGQNWDHKGIGEELEAFNASVGEEVAGGIWSIGRQAEQRRKHAIQEAISMNEIDLAAAAERWGRFDIEPGGNGAAQWEDLPPTLFHATSAVSAIRDSGVLKSRADIGGKASAAGLGGGDDATISFTDNYDVAQGIARSLHEVRRAVNMTNEDLVAALRERSGDWWSEVQAGAKSIHGKDIPETVEDRYNLYRTFSAYRERKDGVLDPLFFNVDPNRLAAMDPDEIGVIGVHPAVDGAKGYRVSALGEWRVPTGRAVQISSTEYQLDHEEFAAIVETFHQRGRHDQQTHGRRYGATRALSEPDGGFTLDADQLQPMKSGWAVALAGSDRLLLASDAFDADGEPSKELVRLTRERIDAAKAADAPEGTKLALGGWHNPDDGKVEVNVTVVFPQSERSRAEAFAADNDQIAMADLEAIASGDWDNAIVNTGGTGGDRDRVVSESEQPERR